MSQMWPRASPTHHRRRHTRDFQRDGGHVARCSPPETLNARVVAGRRPACDCGDRPSTSPETSQSPPPACSLGASGFN